MKKEKTFKNKFSIIIPTLNRFEDLKITYESIKTQTYLPYELIIIDQSDKNIAKEIKRWFEKETKNTTIKIKYVYFNERSSARARNIGIELSKGNITAFLDDDVTLEKDYFERANEFFNKYKNANGVTGQIKRKKKLTVAYLLMRIILKIYKIFFFNDRIRKFAIKGVFSDSAYIILPKKNYAHCQWLSGCNMLIKKDLLKEFKFDNKFVKYSYKEDIDLTNRIYLKYPETLYFNPKMKLEHRVSQKSRLKDKELTKMKYVYFFHIYLKNHKAHFEFYWSTLGYIIYSFLRYLFKRISKKSFSYEIQGLKFAMKHLNKIKNGNVDFYNWE